MTWDTRWPAWEPDPAIPAPRPPSPCEMDAAFIPNAAQRENFVQTLQTYWAAQRAWSTYRRARLVITESSVVAAGSLVVMAWTGWALPALPAAFFALLAIRTWYHTDVSRTTGAMLELDLEVAEQAMFAGLQRRLGR